MHPVLLPAPLIRRLSTRLGPGAGKSPRMIREISGREIIRLSPERPLVVCCQEGSIWLTGGGGNISDVVLEHGGRFEIDAGCSVLIEGLSASRIEIAPC